MKKILFILSVTLSMFSCKPGYNFKTDKGKICSEILEERSYSRTTNHPELIPAIDVLYLRCGCDSIK